MLVLLMQAVASSQVINFEQFPVQPLSDAAAPRVPSYGFDDDSISIGAYVGTYHNAGTDKIWDWATGLGLGILELRVGDPRWIESRIVDTIAQNTDGRVNGIWRQRLIVSCWPFDRVGWSRLVTFFPFDSSESYYWPCKFLQRQGGVAVYNPTEFDHSLSNVQERLYHQNNTTANDTILKQLVMGYDPVYHTYRYTPPPDPWTNDDLSQRSGDAFFERNDLPYRKETAQMWIAVRGHLINPISTGFVGPVALNTDPLFEIEIWNEIPKGSTYLDQNGIVVTAAANLEFLYHTVVVRKQDLMPVGVPLEYDDYREVSIPVNMVRASANGPGGPWNAANTAHRFDLRVRWTGNEMAALRSIALRDSMAEIAHSNSAATALFRDTLHLASEYFLRGHDYNSTDELPTLVNNPPRVEQIIRFYSGDEGLYTRNAMYNYIDSMLYRTAGYGDPDPAISQQRRDTVRGVRAWRAQNGINPQQYVMSSQPEISVESYVHAIDANAMDGIHSENALRAYFDLPPHIYGTPSLEEHNGGRMYNPLLDVAPHRGSDWDTVELYSRAWNRMSIGAYMTGHVRYPYDVPLLSRLGPAAWASRRTGRRLIQWPGTFTTLYLGWHDRTVNGTKTKVFDTIFSHQIEASELRMLVNVGLCYGARGFHYGYLGGTYNEFHEARQVNGGTWRNYQSDWSMVGPRTGDLEETMQTVTLTTHAGWSDPQTYTISPLWVGRQSRQNELGWINREWLPEMAKHMVRLRWRDAYSIHFTTDQSYITARKPRNQSSRPLPGNEIIKSITAVDRYDRTDPARDTYVELGLFDKIAPTPPDLYDTNHVFIVNRRTFERPADILATSPEGKHLDSLAEVRTLRIRFNMQHPVSSHYNFIRVKEINPDLSPLPGGLTRAPLDTIIFGDSSALLTLRPGGAALLRITFCPPEIDIGPAELRRSSQRKLLYANNRYYVTYVRQKTCPFPIPLQPNRKLTEDAVFFRRSLPMTDTTGAIQWEPLEYTVSDTVIEKRFYANRFPSLTLRKLANEQVVVSVVWTNYAGDTLVPGLWVNHRKIRCGPTGVPQFAATERVGFVPSPLDSVYGTPVISALNGGEVIAWSSPPIGILARFRTLGTWNGTGVYSVADSISKRIPNSVAGKPDLVQGGAGRFPSMPPFADLAAEDSTIAIVWEQPTNTEFPLQIRYARLIDTVMGSMTNSMHRLNVRNHLHLSTTSTIAMNPSIDQTQDVYHRLQDGVTWEENRFIQPSNGGSEQYQRWIAFRSLNTETTHNPGEHDQIGVTWRWSLPKRLGKYGYTSDPIMGRDVFPNGASQNQVIDVAHASDSALFAIVGQASYFGRTQRLDVARFAHEWFATRRSGFYLHNGYRPNGSASNERMHLRFAPVYQIPPEPGTNRYSTIHTSRQYFAKARPEGYEAQGRDGLIRMSDSVLAVFTMTLHDVWKSDPTSAEGVPMTTSPVVPWEIDSLSQLRGLMRTGYFQAHDSTTIGFTVGGGFYGDTARASGARLDLVVELMDSASNTVLFRLDSFRIGPGRNREYKGVTQDLDLLSGTYYVRLRIDTAGLVLDSLPRYFHYETSTLQEDIGEAQLSKMRRLGISGSQARIDAFPNPVTTTAEIRFSIPKRSLTSLTLFDPSGKEIVRLIDTEMMEEGRYAVGLDAGALPTGAYLVELRFGSNRTVEKIVVAR